MTAFEILDILCRQDGISGTETSAAAAACKLLSQFCECQTDDMGNVIGTMGSGERHILLDAHIDQIGMRVTQVDKNGFVRVGSCGGVDVRTLPGAQVTIHGNQNIEGIVCCQPPHLKKLASQDTLPAVDEIYIDTGLSGEKAQSLIPLGCPVSLFSKPIKLMNDLYCSKSVDNRAGVAALILCAQALSQQQLNCKVSFLFSCQEETGERGAKVSAFCVDAQQAIAVDVSFDCTPGCTEQKCGHMEKGPMIGISPVLATCISDTLINLAKSNSIGYQTEVMGEGTGTNADVIAVTRGGIKCGLVSIPIKYMHTGVEVVCESDIINTAKLLEQFVENGGACNA